MKNRGKLFQKFAKMRLTFVKNALEVDAGAGKIMALYVIKQLFDRIGASLRAGQHSGQLLTVPLPRVLIKVIDKGLYPGLRPVDPDNVLGRNLLPLRIVFHQYPGCIGKVKELADHDIEVGIGILKVLSERGHARLLPVYVEPDAQRLSC